MARGASDAPVTDWRDTIKGYRGRKRDRRWSWLALVACVVALVAYMWAPWRSFMDFQDVTIETWSCTSPLPDNPSWKVTEQAGCSLDDRGITLVMREDGGTRPENTGAEGRYAFENLPMASPSLVLNVTVPDGATDLVLAQAEANPPVPLFAFNGDAQGVTWSELFNDEGHTKFVLLVGPQP